MPLHLTLPRAAAGPAQGPPRWHHTEELPWLGSGAVKAAAGVVGKIRASWLPCGRPSLAQHSCVGEEELAPVCSTGQQVLQGMCFPIWIGKPFLLASPALHIAPLPLSMRSRTTSPAL